MERVVRMSVIDLDQKRQERNPHISGVATCAACRHEWAAAVPVGTIFLECPKCHTLKGRFVNPALLEPGIERLECQCGCQLFSATRDKLVCINCGRSSDR